MKFERATGPWRCVCGFEDYREHPSCKNCSVSEFTQLDPTIEDRIEAIEDFLEEQ